MNSKQTNVSRPEGENSSARAETRKKKRKSVHEEQDFPLGRDGRNEESPERTPEEPRAQFQFLSISEPYLPPNKTHRQAVRTHVMRNFHSQRRKQSSAPKKKHKLKKKGSKAEAEDDLGEDEISDPSPPTPPTGKVSNSISVASASKDDSSIFGLRKQEDDHVANQGTEVAQHNIARLPAKENLAEAQEAWFTAQTPVDVNTGEPVRADLSQFDRWLFNTSEDPWFESPPEFELTDDPSATPYSLLQGDGAPYLRLDARRWPFPQPLGGLYPKLSVWMPSVFEPPPNMRAPRACLHKSSQVLPYIENSAEFFEFKGKTIRWINERLKDITLGINDTTMGSIMLLISFELKIDIPWAKATRGNVAECVKHMDGIERIVTLRGGIDEWKSKRPIQIKILLLDMTVAALSNNPPRFPILRATHPMPCIPSPIYRIYDSPLYSTAPFSTSLSGSEFTQESIQILQRMRDLTVFVTRGLNINIGALDPLSCPPAQGIFQSHADVALRAAGIIYPSRPSLHRIIQLTSSIYIRALSNPPASFSSRANRASALELCRAIESPANDETWDRFPGIFVWCLLTGAAAARDMPEHSLLVSLLTRTGLGAGYGWWEEFSEGMHTFMKVKRRAERR